MKILAALVLSLASVNAHAELKANGTVLARECAQQVTSSKAPAQQIEVCYADIVGRNGSYLTIGKDVWAITDSTSRKLSFDHVGFIGERGVFENRYSLDMRLGTAVSSDRDSLEIDTGRETVRASKFEIVYHTQSL